MVKDRAKEWIFFLSALKCDKQLCLALQARCRYTLSSKNYDVKMMHTHSHKHTHYYTRTLLHGKMASNTPFNIVETNSSTVNSGTITTPQQNVQENEFKVVIKWAALRT